MARGVYEVQNSCPRLGSRLICPKWTMRVTDYFTNISWFEMDICKSLSIDGIVMIKDGGYLRFVALQTRLSLCSDGQLYGV